MKLDNNITDKALWVNRLQKQDEYETCTDEEADKLYEEYLSTYSLPFMAARITDLHESLKLLGKEGDVEVQSLRVRVGKFTLDVQHDGHATVFDSLGESISFIGGFPERKSYVKDIAKQLAEPLESTLESEYAEMFAAAEILEQLGLGIKDRVMEYNWGNPRLKLLTKQETVIITQSLNISCGEVMIPCRSYKGAKSGPGVERCRAFVEAIKTIEEF